MQEDVLNGTLKGGLVYTEIQKTGIALLFDYIDDETLTTEAAITDNFVESNYAVQDHIAIKPRIYRLRGCVGEVVFKGGSEWIRYLGDEIKNNHPLLQKTLNAMKPIKAISGVVSNYTQAAINVVKQVESSYNRYAKMVKDITDPNPISGKRQQELVSILNYILQNRIEVNLENLKFNYESELFSKPKYEKKYFLQSVSSHQGNNDFISDIEITIKEVRMASTQTSTLDPKKFAAIGSIPTVDVMKEKEVFEGKATGNNIPTNKATEVINQVGDKVKNATKQALQGHPLLYDATKTTYHGLVKIGEFVENATGIRTH